MAVPCGHSASRCSRMLRQRYCRLVVSLAFLFASFPVTECQCSISPSTIYARIGDQASFSCSHDAMVLPASFTLNGIKYQSHNSFPGYQNNIYTNGVFTLLFNRTSVFSEPSSVSCMYQGCTTAQATIRNPDPPHPVDEPSITVQPSLTSIAVSWSAATPFPGYPVTHYNIELLSGLSPVFSSTTNKTSITIRNLLADRQYSLSIVTVSDSGSSVPTSKTVMTSPLGTVTSPDSRVEALLDGTATLTWSFTLDQEVTAAPVILLNSMQYSLAELNAMTGVSVQESATMTAIVLTAVAVERNGSKWQWMLEEFGSALHSDESMLLVQGPPLAPPPPTYLTLGPSVALLLSEPPFSHLPITGYTILYYSMDSPGTVTNITVSPGTVEVILTGIRPNQNYNVTIYASNAAGISEGTSIPIPSRVIIGLPSCPSETDPHWMLMWITLYEDEMQSQLCIPMQDDSGLASRRCGTGGEWDDPNVLSCQTPGYSQITQQTHFISAESCYAIDPIVGCLENVSALINQLVELIRDSDVIFPSDLEVTAVALQNSTRLQESAISQGFDVSLPLEDEEMVEHYLQVYDTLVNATNSFGWTLLLEENDTFAGDYLLQSFQRLAMILANNTECVDGCVRDNFELQVVPTSAESSVVLSSGVVVQVTGAEGASSIVAGTVDHVAAVLPPFWPSGITSAESNNVLAIVESSVLGSTVDFTPNVTVTFQFSELLYRPRCARWDYSASTVRSQGRGAWSTQGVMTVSDKWSMQVVCHSSRQFGPITVLTSIEGPALDFSAAPVSIAFYAGSVLGLLFLCFSLAPLIIFTYQDSKADDRRPILNVSQLNYTIVAIATLVILTAGIETGRNTDASSTFVSVGCKVTAALLHYSFLALFMWMFTTVLVAFCLHAEVGRVLVKRWWSVLILAYPPAVVVVAIASPVAHPYYGSELGCWLSAQRGTHWAFFVPAIVIALATVVLLVLAMVSVFRNRTEDRATDEDEELLNQRRELIGGIVAYTFIHFPCLCLTWLFGFLYLGTGNVAFAYVYAVLLTLQSAVFASYQMLRVRRIRRFWTETLYTRLKLNLSTLRRQPSAPPSVANPRALTGRYNADGRLIGGVSVLNSTDESPFGTEDTGTNRTEETVVYMW